jgi:hypothetical protein
MGKQNLKMNKMKKIENEESGLWSYYGPSAIASHDF